MTLSLHHEIYLFFSNIHEYTQKNANNVKNDSERAK